MSRRVLVATDGSASARTAIELVRAFAWPAGTTLRLVHVVSPLPALVQSGLARRSFDRLDEPLRGSLVETAEHLRRADITVGIDVLSDGEPADRIVRDAREFRADLVVVGSRGHGAIATMLLGSVASAIVDHAPCPVLVVRRPSCARVILAEDGSLGAFEARQLLATWPIFERMAIRVVSVAHLTAPLLSGIASTMLEEARRARDELLVETRTAYGRLASESAEQLRIAGRRAESDVRSGDVAAEILTSAREMSADLIAMGSRGHGAMTRLLLGGVARNVLTHATCSILIARQQQT
ncbi:MAG: universal stress protein [Chloroflexota bacterium]